MNVTHPVDQRSMSRINVDLIDQVVVETAGHAAEAGPGQGAYVNVIHRPGGSSFQGSLAYTNASKGLGKSLWSAEEIAEMGGAVLPSLQREHDFSLTLGGPMLADNAWLFANIARLFKAIHELIYQLLKKGISLVLDATWGVSRTFFKDFRGLSPGNGSFSKTSRPAPAIRFS